MADDHRLKVSIITPAYNTASLIAKCLDSVFAQTYQDFEVIVVNDGSPDTPELEKVLQPYLGRIVYIKQSNKRAAGARNTAIGVARGEYLAFLDSDDVWLPEHLALQMGLFEKDASLDMVYANGLRVGDPKRPREIMKLCPSEGPANFEALVLERCQVPISTVVVRKAAIIKAGLFDESMPRCDDYDMWLRTAFHGARIGYTRTVQALCNGGRPDSLGVSSVKMLEAYVSILEKADRELPLTDSQRDVVRRRALEMRSRYLVEEGKSELQQRHFENARRLFAEANSHLKSPKLTLTLLGLRLVPGATSSLVSGWNRFCRTTKRAFSRPASLRGKPLRAAE